ncbi:MAG: Copper ion-binding [Thermoanaerobacterales bacterium 50_218]|nr:MAG: Copper ion-binding [Thermoanaerobacterales bacterium 50_218]HAA89023.1 copper resistance protein CopZ [Peptococcaceae bacterium]
MTEQVVLKVEGMSCRHCKVAVENSLKNIPGVKDAVVDLKDNTVKVSYEKGKVALDDLEKAIADAGYKVVK